MRSQSEVDISVTVNEDANEQNTDGLLVRKYTVNQAFYQNEVNNISQIINFEQNNLSMLNIRLDILKVTEDIDEVNSIIDTAIGSSGKPPINAPNFDNFTYDEIKFIENKLEANTDMYLVNPYFGISDDEGLSLYGIRGTNLLIELRGDDIILEFIFNVLSYFQVLKELEYAEARIKTKIINHIVKVYNIYKITFISNTYISLAPFLGQL